MKKTQLYILLIALITLFSCQNRSNIVVSGQVLDETTGKPIPNAEVVVLCWYSHNIDDASYHKQILLTDSEGKYQPNGTTNLTYSQSDIDLEDFLVDYRFR